MDDASPTGSNRSYRCGAIVIDASQRSVFLDGAPAKLGARAFDVLLALVERRERVVPKRELMDLVWPRLIVEEGNLPVHIVALRKLLGPQAIATIPGRGYRFAMPVDAVIDGGSVAPAPGATPPAVAREANPGNLPASPPLFGRAQDLAVVDALLCGHAVVSIVGAGGIGKTRLAQAAAAAAARFDFPDGRWWIDLASINEGTQIADCIAAAIGVQAPAGNLPHEGLVRLLASQRLLLVLDNCEQLAEDIARLVDLLRARAPNVRLLVTSQESLKCCDEQVYRLGALALPETTQLEEAVEFGAVALFAERAFAVDPRFRLTSENVAAVIDICRRLDGIPLAIELAAARVPLLGVQGMHARIDQIFGLLTGGARIKLRRHQTLRAAFEWSHGLLSADEQTAFRRLGVFVGGFTLELAQRLVCDESIDQWQVLDLLGHLIDKSLVIAGDEAEPRYRLLEATRAFALEQLAAAGESDAMLRRHAQVVLELMRATDANCWNLLPAERERAVRELGNLRAAVDWAIDAEAQPTLAYELLGMSWLVWMNNGLAHEAVKRMLRLWPQRANVPPRLEADYCLGLARVNLAGAREEMWQAARRAETLFREFGDADRLGDALLLAATIGFRLNHEHEAEQALREAEALVTEAAPLRKQAALAATQGACYGWLGAPQRAITAYRRQGELYRRAGAVLGEYLALGNAGFAQLDAGDLDGAIESLRKSAEGLQRLNAPNKREFPLRGLAIALAVRGDDVDILKLAHSALDTLRSSDSTCVPLLVAAWHHARRADLRRAAVLAGYARSERSRTTKRPWPIFDQLERKVRDRVVAAHPLATVDGWLREGEALAEAQALAVAFDEAPLDGLS